MREVPQTMPNGSFPTKGRERQEAFVAGEKRKPDLPQRVQQNPDDSRN